MMKLLVLASVLAPGCAGEDDPGGSQDGADELIESDEDLIPDLPVLIDPGVIFHPPPEFAAVQPTASLQFRYASCAKRVWTVERKAQKVLEGERVMLRLQDQAVDCFGPTIEREYTVQVSSDAGIDDRYVLINPTQLSSVPEAAE
jgi:hypothetical protein